jgi:hypothetical protein
MAPYSTIFSMEDLVLRRHLGRAFAGMQRDQICAVLGIPDDWMDDAKRPGVATALIWRYGLFEVHFIGDLAMSLFTDYLNDLDAGPGRTVEPWIIVPMWSRTLSATCERLEQQRVDYVVHRDSLRQPFLRVTNGADLLFDNSDAADVFVWNAICASAPE